MSRVSLLSAVILFAFTTGFCQADTLVITYRSGRTQTVVLDEPSQGINSWQFVGGTASLQQSKKQDEAAPIPQEQVQKQPQADGKATEKAPEKKSGIRIKWNAKPIPD